MKWRFCSVGCVLEPPRSWYTYGAPGVGARGVVEDAVARRGIARDWGCLAERVADDLHWRAGKAVLLESHASHDGALLPRQRPRVSLALRVPASAFAFRCGNAPRACRMGAVAGARCVLEQPAAAVSDRSSGLSATGRKPRKQQCQALISV